MSGTSPRPCIPDWLFSMGLSPVQFMILCKLWRHAGKDQTAYPSAATIAAACGIREKTVWPALNALEGKRAFTRTKKTTDKGLVNLYRLQSVQGTSPLKGVVRSKVPGSVPLTVLAPVRSTDYEVIQGSNPRSNPLPAGKPARARDPLFDSLATACGQDPRQMTSTAARTCGVKLAEIRKASPDVTPDEITRRAKAYRTAHPTWSITPAALCSHWAEFAATATTSPETWGTPA